MKPRPKPNMLIPTLLLLGIGVLQRPLFADLSPEQLCEKLYADTLNRAKEALAEAKREDALRFLLNAAEIAERCAGSPEEPHRQKQGRESVLALDAGESSLT